MDEFREGRVHNSWFSTVIACEIQQSGLNGVVLRGKKKEKKVDVFLGRKKRNKSLNGQNGVTSLAEFQTKQKKTFRVVRVLNIAACWRNNFEYYNIGLH